MGQYKKTNTVDPARTRADIERILDRYNAQGFAYAREETRAGIIFKMQGHSVKFILHMPDRASDEIRFDGHGRERLAGGQEYAYEQVVGQRWRALFLCIKAKLEAVESGIVLFEDEFLPHFVLPDGRTVAERARTDPDFQKALLEGGEMRPLLKM